MSVNEKDIEKDLTQEREKQAKEKKVKLTIPRDPLNPQKTVWVSVNGQEYYLAVGKTIEVPESVAEVWNESYSKTVEAQMNMEKMDEI